jgi:histidine triad (HIT) family protein
MTESNPSATAPSLFTKIIRGEIPSHKIYENDRVFAFLDIDPLSDGHVLVVPKLQVDKLYELPDADYQALFDAVKTIAAHMEKVLGVRIGLVVEGLEIPHAHVHLVPLYDRDVMRLHHGYPVHKSDSELAAMAEKLRFTGNK